MPVVLIIAFAASLGMHALVLFAPEVDLSLGSEPPALVAELKAPPPEAPQPVARSDAKQGAAVTRRKARRRPVAPAAPQPGLSAPPSATGEPIPATAAWQAEQPAAGEDGAAPTVAPQATAAQLPARGMVRYRVDRGDQGFEIGFSLHTWEAVDGAYRITAVTETSGLIGIFRPLRYEVESRGRLTAGGLLPELVVTRQKGRESEERAEFDWDRMELRVSGRPAEVLRPGSQDLLSFPYQLGLLADPGSLGSLPILTGKRYADYPVEVIGDEEISVPAGTFHCLHLRVPGVATTELWLAHERALLPVKIQHLDRKGDLYVQVATVIEFSEEAP